MRRRSIYCPVKTVTQPPSPFLRNKAVLRLIRTALRKGNRACAAVSRRLRQQTKCRESGKDGADAAPANAFKTAKRTLFSRTYRKNASFSANKKGTAAAVPFLYCPPLTRRAQPLYARILPLAFSSGANTPPTTERFIKCTMSPRSA